VTSVPKLFSLRIDPGVPVCKTSICIMRYFSCRCSMDGRWWRSLPSGYV
jgi:hypothetical protein